MEKDLKQVNKHIDRTYSSISKLLVDGDFNEVDTKEIRLKKYLIKKSRDISIKYSDNQSKVSNILFGMALLRREIAYLDSIPSTNPTSTN